jgi:magnesium chelatase family protein
MLAKVRTGVLTGLDALSIDVEVRVRDGAPAFTIIGLGDGAVRESRERVMSALRQTGFGLPDQILVSLAPAEIKKEGAGLDLSIALGILLASGQLASEVAVGRSFHGELSLDGAIRPVRGILALTIEALEKGVREAVVPVENEAEARLITGVQTVGVTSLAELIEYLRDGVEPRGGARHSALAPAVRGEERLISDVWGQDSAKRGLIIAAAGGHNILLIGPPGCGKSMLASAFGSLTPALTKEETLEVVKIHSVAGLPIKDILLGARPFRSPHHIISDVGLIGGGSAPRPGEISLAHRGVLFLDEFPEFRRSALESMRAPLESGAVNIVRAKAAVTFPASFQLIAAMNPCPCGRLGAPGGGCLCSRNAIHNYIAKISQPILDRIDLHVELSAVPLSRITTGPTTDRLSEELRLRAAVAQARERQLYRSRHLNSTLSAIQIKDVLQADAAALNLLETVAAKIGLSARGYLRILRVARTIADLAGEARVSAAHVAEAAQFRSLERLERYCRGGALGPAVEIHHRTV